MEVILDSGRENCRAFEVLVLSWRVIADEQSIRNLKCVVDTAALRTKALQICANKIIPINPLSGRLFVFLECL